MCWQLLAALLLVALANAGQSAPGTEETTASHLAEPLDEVSATEATNKGSATETANKGSVIEAAPKACLTKSESRQIIYTLLRNITNAFYRYSPGSQELQTALQSLANALRTLTLPKYIETTYNVPVGIFPDPSKGVYMGKNSTHWNSFTSQGGYFTDDQPVESTASLDEVVGVVVNGLTARRTVLVAPNWKSINNETLASDKNETLANNTHFMQKRTINVFLYDTEGDEESVQVFWEPYHEITRGVRCKAWVPGQGWDGGRCETAAFGAGLVGCRCRRATFGEGVLRRASFLVVELSDTFVRKAFSKMIKRTSFYLRNGHVFADGLKIGIRALHPLQHAYSYFIYNPLNETFGLLLDGGAAVHKTNYSPNETVFLDDGSKLTLAAVEGDGGTPLAGLYVGKRWPSDNPEEAAFHAAAVRPGGSWSWLESTSDTEVFAVRIVGNVSLPRRASLLLTRWDENGRQSYSCEEAIPMKRVADLVFSGEEDDLVVGGVEVVFETLSRDWTKIRCIAWDFHESAWNDSACTSHNISLRLHSCRCPKALFKIDDLLRARVQIIEDGPNKMAFVYLDSFNRTLHHISHLAQLSLPGNQLPNVTALLDNNVLIKVCGHGFALPSHLVDDLASILQRSALDPSNSNAFFWHGEPCRIWGFKENAIATIFVQDRVNDSLATVALSNEYGRVMNSAENDVADFKVAVSFDPPQNGVGRVAVTYIATEPTLFSHATSHNQSHNATRVVDLSWRQNSLSSVKYEVVLRLKPFATVEYNGVITVQSKTCRYWDIERRDWTEGCTIRLEDGKELCRCMISTTNVNAIGHARFHVASEWSVHF